MARIAVIGNAGGGKSTLARKLAAAQGLKLVEVDRLLWQEGWVPVPAEAYARAHDGIVGEPAWVIDGLGRQESIPSRLARATEIVLVDMPLWVHFWLAAERQIAWASGRSEHMPAGLPQPPQTQALFRTMWDVDRDWMPAIRASCLEAEGRGTRVIRIASFDDLQAFAPR